MYEILIIVSAMNGSTVTHTAGHFDRRSDALAFAKRYRGSPHKITVTRIA